MPLYRHFLLGIVQHDGIDGFRKNDFAVQVTNQAHIFNGIRPIFYRIAVSHQREHLQRFQHITLCVKKCLIVHGAAAVPLTCILGVILRRKGGCPAGAVFLPECGIFLPACAAGRNPCAFPIEDTNAVCGLVHHGIDDRTDKIRLPLQGHGVIRDHRTALTDGIGAEIRILCRKRIGGFRHHHLLAVGFGNFGQHLRKIFQRAVPVGVVGRGEYVVIHLIVVKILAVACVAVGIFGVRKMDGDERIGANLTDCLGACVHQLGNSRPAAQIGTLFAAHGAVGFVADLHHAHIHTGIYQFLQALLGVLIQGFAFFFDAHVLPRLGGHLLAGVCPEVGIMEIHQQFHAILSGTFADFHRIVDVAVAAAVAVAVCIVGIVPDTDTDIIDAVLAQDLIDILFRSVEVKILHTALFQRRNAGGIHAHDKILGQILYLLHIQSIGTDLRFLIHVFTLPCAATGG